MHFNTPLKRILNCLVTIIVFYIFIFKQPNICAQQAENTKKTVILNLQEAIELSRQQSPQAIRARHEFKANYWEYRTYKAGRLPNLNFNSNPINLNRSLGQITLDDGKESFVERKSLSSEAGISLNQNITPTGGQLFVNSGIGRIDPLNPDYDIVFMSRPMISIGINQPLNGYNSMKWQKKIEPLKYERARRNYIMAIEDVASRGISLFFDLALAQLNLEIANTNYSNTDTLYKIARGRYNIGTIAENELLQMELSLLNAGTELNRASIDLVHKKAILGSFLGFNDKVEIQIILPELPQTGQFSLEKVLSSAFANNPELLNYELQLLEAEREVARTRAEKRYSANVYAEYGLNKTDREWQKIYNEPDNMQMLQIGLQIPLVDWGARTGKHKMALSNRELVRTIIDQQRTGFEQNIFLKVMQYNLQGQQLFTAAKADSVARLRYELTKQRFLIGKISITELNIALTEKDIARRGYINTLQNYYGNLYEIRRISLYDFISDNAIESDLDKWMDD